MQQFMMTTGLINPSEEVMNFSRNLKSLSPYLECVEEYGESQDSNWTASADNFVVNSTRTTFYDETFDYVYFSEVHCHFMGNVYTTALVRDRHDILGFYSSNDEEDIPLEDSIETFSIDDSQSLESISTIPSDVDIPDDYDFFDEAMEMFPPEEIIFDDFESETKTPLCTIPEMECQNGTENYTLNSEFDELPEKEVRQRIERKLKCASIIKTKIMSISASQIHEAKCALELKFSQSELRRQSYLPQGGGEHDTVEHWLNKLDLLSSRVADYSKILSSGEVDCVIKHIERLILLFLELKETRSYTGIMAALFGYLQGLLGRSLFNTVREYLAESFAMESQAGEEDEVSPEWLGIFRSVTSNWKNITKLPAWRYFQRILSLAVSAGLCRAANVQFTIGDMKMFTLKVEERQSSAFDLLDAILSTADYFVEAGYEAFKTRSLRPFFFDNQTARILDDAYIGIGASMKALCTGDLGNTKYTTEQELAHVLENTLSGYVILRHQTKNPTEKRTLDSRCMQLEEWKLQFIQQTVAGGLREAPYSIYLVGKPGIGKSMMTQVLVEVVMQANGVKYTQKQVATVNPGDKFASTVKNDTVVIILDDFGNFVLEFENENPLKYIIEICNNVVSYVPKAEANEKGKVSWRPKMVVTTSNLDDLLFNKLSNAPASARRRGYRMKPFLKEEYAEHDRFSEDKYRAIHGNMPAIPDAYDIDIQEWGVKRWEYMSFNGKSTEKMSYADALAFHVMNSRQHFKKQKNLVENHGKIRDQIHICEHGRVESSCFDCSKYEPHFGTETLLKWFWRWLVSSFFQWMSPLFTNFSTYLQNSSNEQLQSLNTKLHYFSMFGVYDWLPEKVVESRWFERYLLFVNSGSLLLQYWQLMVAFLASFSLFLLGPSVGGALNGLVVWPFLFQSATVTHVAVIKAFRDRRGALPLEFTSSRDKFLKYALTGTFLLGGLAAAYKIYQSTKMMEPHGNIAPTSMSDIRKRDAEQSVWSRTVPEALPFSDKSKCIDHETLVQKVQKNLVYVNYQEEDGSVKYTDGFFCRSNELLIPYHILSDTPRKYTIFRRGENVKGARFSEILSVSSAIVHPTKDLAFVQCCNTAPFADLTSYFSLTELDRVPFSLSHQAKDGSHSRGHGVLVQRQVDNSVRKFAGYEYKLHDLNTFQGLCMATLVSQTRAPSICGFHIGGRGGTGHGCAVSITLEEYQSLRTAYYDQHVSALQMISEGTVFTEHYGEEWFENGNIHEKSPLNYIDDDSNVRYFGSCFGRSTAHYSNVVSTPIADFVSEICDTHQEYAGPHFHRWKSWYESLVYSSNPSIGCETSILDWAVEDYKTQLWQVFEVDGVRESVKKLSEIEIVSGQDGIRFIDGMPADTSCGYPLLGPKRERMFDLEPNDEHNCPRTFDTVIWEEVDRFKTSLKNGERYYPMFKTCLKDEPTKIEKEKVRAFQAAPLTVQIVMREMFLPVARVMSLFPLISECAVGINSQGPEWHSLQAHIKKFGADRIVAGDYSKYDLRMSAKLTSAAFKILIDFAEFCGYSDEDLTIMRGVATEVVYPMMSYNGDIVMLQGSNPSGQNLTVYINSIVNSLLNRVGFRMIYPFYEGKFSDAVALATYGDDFKSSASVDFPLFHHISLAEKLSSIDMKITMPDKEAEPTPYMVDEECDFLKRKNRLHEVGLYLGALDEDSIFKSLKAVLRSNFCSLKEQSAQNIDGALREWFYHGEEVYERRRTQITEVAEKAGIRHMCFLLDSTFSDRVEAWKSKYASNDDGETS